MLMLKDVLGTHYKFFSNNSQKDRAIGFHHIAKANVRTLSTVI